MRNAERVAFTTVDPALGEAGLMPQLILGQVNFFLEFDVCFYRGRRTFELRPKA